MSRKKSIKASKFDGYQTTEREHLAVKEYMIKYDAEPRFKKTKDKFELDQPELALKHGSHTQESRSEKKRIQMLLQTSNKLLLEID